ncbi:endolysin [Cronobacter phage A24]|uniref:L-alanyl-D-glutamate peptidase n=1 Tax=Cronobacter phage A24 TaxID=2795745 RepID=A0A7T5UEJ1_9CAUD|nr:endolysin [Cronobacter phage A24]QQG33666.1 L-alanyl-D-glutamate peptidase [Cronobacter phage A24]
MNVKLSKKGQALLATRKQALQDVINKSFEKMPFDITILASTVRTEEEQRANIAKGVSWTMKSKHLTGEAVDMAPYPVDWNNLERFVQMAEVVLATAKEMGIPVVWGGTWKETTEGWKQNKRFDGPHFELK